MHTVWQQKESAHPMRVWVMKQLVSSPAFVSPPHAQLSLLQLGVTSAICVQLMSQEWVQQKGSSAQTAAQHRLLLQYGVECAMQHGPVLTAPQPWHAAACVSTQLWSQLVVQQYGFRLQTVVQHVESSQ
jgi:hypothetical protein